MFLNHDEIQNEIQFNGLIENHISTNIDNVSYKCRIGKIILPYSKRPKWQLWNKKRAVLDDEPLKLSPSEIVIVETLEKVNLPKHLGCLYSIPQSRAQDGLLLLNASFIEPNYKGKLSCYLINISKKDIVLYPKMDIAKLLIFHTQQRANARRLEYSDAEYTQNLQKQVLHFGRTFLNIDEIKNLAAKKATSKVNRSLTIGGLVILLLLAFSSLQPLFDNFLTKRYFREGKVETGLMRSFIKMEDENLELKKSVEEYKDIVKENSQLLDSLINVINLKSKAKPEQGKK